MRFANTSCLLLVALILSVLSAFAQKPSDPVVYLDTNRGRIVIRVFHSMVPYTAEHFLKLVDSGFYNGLAFHRVENWVVQGGDPNGNGTGNYVDPQTGAPQFLKLQCHPFLNHNRPGMVAMARGNNPNSASCQFYILKRAMPQLNGKYAVFGEVLDGASVVMKLQRGDVIVAAHVMSANEVPAESPAPTPQAEPASTPPPPPPESKIRRFRKDDEGRQSGSDGVGAPSNGSGQPKENGSESGF